MPRSADWVAHIVETIEKADQVVVVASVVLRCRLREGHAVRNSGGRSALGRRNDRGGAIVKAEKA